MGALRTDRLWLLGWVVVTVLLVTAGWFLLIHPVYAETATVRDQAGDETVQLTKLNHQVAQLTAKKKDLPALKAQLAANRGALPVDSIGITAFLRQLQDSGNAVQVDVSGFTVGDPVKAASTANDFALPITMITSGDADNVTQFLNRLQNKQARAVLINSVSWAAGADPTHANEVQANISLTVFAYSTNGTGTTLTTN